MVEQPDKAPVEGGLGKMVEDFTRNARTTMPTLRTGIASREVKPQDDAPALAVPEYIAKSTEAVQSYGTKHAEAIEEAADKQFAEDKVRHENAHALAKRIRDEAAKQATAMGEWASRTHNANQEIKEALQRLSNDSAPPEKKHR